MEATYTENGDAIVIHYEKNSNPFFRLLAAEKGISTIEPTASEFLAMSDEEKQAFYNTL